MDENTPKKIKIGMAVVVIAAIATMFLTAYSRGWL